MSWKKSGFGYVMWFLYTLFVLWLLLETSGASGVLSGAVSYATALPAVVILSVVGLLALIFNQLVAKRVRKALENAELAWLAEMAAVVVFLVLGVSDRMQRMTGVGELAPYFETAQVTAGQSLPRTVHGAEYLYLQLLHIVFLFLGNKFIAGIWLQIVLQLAAVMLLYPGVRKLAGPVPALAMTGFFMCSGFGMRMSLTLSPQMLYLLLFAAGFSLLACCREKKGLFLFLVSGLCIGITGYFDLSGFLLLIFLTAVAAQTDDRRRAGRFGLGLAGVAVGFFGSILLDAFFSDRPLMGVLEAWWQLYIPKDFAWAGLRVGGSTGWGTLLLAVLLSFGIFSFWGGRGRERMSLWALAAGCSAAMGCLEMLPAVMWADVYVYLFLAVLVGIGIKECFWTEEAVAAISDDRSEPAALEVRDLEARVLWAEAKQEQSLAESPVQATQAQAAQIQVTQVQTAVQEHAKKREQAEERESEAAAPATNNATETLGTEGPGAVQEPRKEAKMSEKENEIKKTKVRDFEFVEVSLSAPINLELPKPAPEPIPEEPKTVEAEATVQSDQYGSSGSVLTGTAAYGFGSYGTQDEAAGGQTQEQQPEAVEEVQPVQEMQPAEEVQFVQEVQPVEEVRFVQEAQPVEETQPVQEAQPAEEPPKETKYIDNPLPLPKPHKKRVLDFDRKSGAPADDYDYPVDENDDFDIK